MDYTLAKELKEAGFPQSTEHSIERPTGNFISNPTLSELIEACGDDIRYLLRDNEGNWEAAEGVLMGKQVGHHLSVSCGTIEEAVARLWLALNKK